MRPSVALVGAGPGDPELITLKAMRRLEQADLVLYDALVDPALLGYCKPAARRFYVGKRAGRHSISQRALERLMIRAARRGARVVRLKCGDPYVLGRGGEEAHALARANIAFEVIPGVSSALAAPASLGIPLTHRGTSSSFVVFSAHAPSAYRELLASLKPASLTLVALMGTRHRADLQKQLLDAGWAASTPAALIWAASHSHQSEWVGTLAELPNAPTEKAPGTIVIGHVIDDRVATAWTASPMQGVAQ